MEPEERRWYTPHVLLELAGLHAEIEAVQPEAEREFLRMLFSAIVVKFSRQRAETSNDAIDKTIGKHVPTRFFARKASEVLEQLAAFTAACPANAPQPVLAVGDTRELGKLVPDAGTFALVLSSPPYAGTYDYVDHHARRYPWLGIDPRRLKTQELGARRNYRHDVRGRSDDRIVRWDRELTVALRVIHERMAPGARCVLLVGDGEIGRERIAADAQIERLASANGMRVRAVVSQGRRDWQGGPDRAEHLVAIERRDRPPR
jgi:hypothetical protein